MKFNSDFNTKIFLKEYEWQNYDLMQQIKSSFSDTTSGRFYKILRELILAILSGTISIVVTFSSQLNVSPSSSQMWFRVLIALLAFFGTYLVGFLILKFYNFIRIEVLNKRTSSEYTEMAQLFSYKIIPEVLMVEHYTHQLKSALKTHDDIRYNMIRHYFIFLINTLYDSRDFFVEIHSIMDDHKEDRKILFYMCNFSSNQIDITLYLNIIDNVIDSINDIKLLLNEHGEKSKFSVNEITILLNRLNSLNSTFRQFRMQINLIREYFYEICLKNKPDS